MTRPGWRVRLSDRAATDFAEIIELHHDQKVDSPSGTAKTTAEGMLAARGRPFTHPESEKEPLPGARGLGRACDRKSVCLNPRLTRQR